MPVLTTRVAHLIARPANRNLKRQLTSLIFSKHGHVEIVSRAARIVEAPVALWDTRGTGLAFAGFCESGVSRLSASFERLRDAALASREPQFVSTDVLPHGAFAMAIHDDHGAIAFLLVGASEACDHAETAEAAEQIAGIVLFEFLRQRTVQSTEERLGNSVFHELLDPENQTPELLERISGRSRLLGYDLSGAYWVVVVENAAQGPDPAAREMLRGAVQTIARAFRGAISIERDHGTVLLLAQASVGRGALDKLHGLLRAVIATTAKDSCPLLVAGLSESSVTVGQIAAEVERVRCSIELNRKLENREIVVLQRTLRPYRLLMAVREKQELLDYWSETIRELYQYDTLNRGSLIQTLAVFFECCSNVIEASRRLFIHRNTMNRRLQRIEDILDASLSDAETLFRLQLALRVHEMVLAQGLLK
jgi:sugar diacid utilization regulator